MLSGADYAKNYAGILYQCLPTGQLHEAAGFAPRAGLLRRMCHHLRGKVRMKNHEKHSRGVIFDLESRASRHCWVRPNSIESTPFQCGPVEGGFQGMPETDDEALSLHMNCNMFHPQGLNVCPQCLGSRPFFQTFRPSCVFS